jgi:hypothetical protein
MKKLVIVLLLLSSPAFAQQGWKKFRTGATRQGVDLVFEYPPNYPQPTREKNDTSDLVGTTLGLDIIPPTISLLAISFNKWADPFIKEPHGKKEEMAYLLEVFRSTARDRDFDIYSTKTIMHSIYPGILTRYIDPLRKAGTIYGFAYVEMMNILAKDNYILVSCQTASETVDISVVTKLHQNYTAHLCKPFFESLDVY